VDETLRMRGRRVRRPAHDSSVMATYLDLANDRRDDLVTLRHALHQDPEIGLQLPRTQQRVLDALDTLPLEITLGQRTSSITAVLRGTHPDRPSTDAPVVLLRADMDGLPVPEETGLWYASKVPGAMHACGHDLHTSMLATAAALLAERQADLQGDVVLMFQPGEEMHDGAAVMVEEGVLDAAGRRVDAAYGMHVFSALVPQGQFVSRRGAMLAAADGFLVTIRGKGGHGSTPHTALDPVPVACELVGALQTLVTRRFSIFDPIVVNVGSIHAGEAPNVIPEFAELKASVRSWSHEAKAQFRSDAERLARGIAGAYGMTAEVTHIDGYPVTLTTPAETDFVADTVADLFGRERFTHMEHPFAGSEDFSRVLAQVPGSFIGLGAVPAGIDPATAPFNHSSYAQYDDAVLPLGTALYAELATRRLARLAADRLPASH